MSRDLGNIRIQGKEVFLRVGREWYHYDSSIRPLGAGAMGRVYLGRHYMNSHDLVAIKQVNPAYSRSRAIRERARLEASLAFRHRNLVEMIGCCEDGDLNGPMFIISRLVQGVTIDRYVEQTFANRADRVARIVKCMFPVLDALDYIHSKGIIHLDIKPSNIMVENGSNIRLMDLGIAYTSAQTGINGTGLLGTPGYAAPEQYINDINDYPTFDARTDIYQVGATLYNLIGSGKPYEEDTEQLKPLDGVGKRLMKVIARSLDRDQNRRQASAREFSRELREAIESKPSLWERIFN